MPVNPAQRKMNELAHKPMNHWNEYAVPFFSMISLKMVCLRTKLWHLSSHHLYFQLPILIINMLLVMPIFSILLGQVNDIFSSDKFADPSYKLENSIEPIVLRFLYILFVYFPLFLLPAFMPSCHPASLSSPLPFLPPSSSFPSSLKIFRYWNCFICAHISRPAYGRGVARGKFAESEKIIWKRF